MAYQFFHIETYSEAPKRVHGSKDHFNTAEQVEEEARRTPAWSEHVTSPMPFVQVGGTLKIDDFIALRRKRVAEIRETVTAKDGTSYTRSLRKDAATLYTEIHSHPIKSADYIAAPDEHIAEVQRWKQHLLRDFRKRMPRDIQFTAVLHADETHLHIHILAFNAGDAKLDANKLHAGKRAGAEYREASGSDAIVSLPRPDLLERPSKPKKPRPSKNRATQKKNNVGYAEEVAAWEAECAPIDAENSRRLEVWGAANRAHLKAARDARGTNGATKAYVAAMRKVQDDYYEAVGKPCGLLRHGPRQARKSTKQYVAEQKQAKLMADEMGRLDRQRQEQDAKAAALVAREAGITAEENALAKREAGHEAELAVRAKALDDQRATLFRAEAEMRNALAAKAEALEEKEKELRSREAELTGAMDAMGQVLDAVENGAAEVVGGKLYMPKLPGFFRRMATPAVQDTPSSPIIGLVRRFLWLIVRTQSRLGGNAPDADSHQNHGPGW